MTVLSDVQMRAEAAKIDGFSHPHPELVHDVVSSLDITPRQWDMANAVAFYHADHENGILSTTTPFTIKAMGENRWKSPEALFHAQKFPEDYDMQTAILQAISPLDAKAIGRKHKISRRPDWNKHKPTAMTRVLLLRIEQDAAYRSFLSSTGNCEIVEDTTAGDHDNFWGVIEGKGVNLAGQIAMALRSFLVARDKRIHIP